MKTRIIHELQQKFEASSFEIIKLPLAKPMDKLSIYLDYSAKESMTVDGKQLGISWLPHIEDMPESYYGLIFERIEEAVTDLMGE